MRYPLRTTFLLSLLGFVWSSATQAENWPQWRGPNNNSVSTEKNLPSELDVDKNLAWKLKLPAMGGSTPAIWGNQLFLTAEDGEDLVVLAIDLSGKQLWKTKVGKGKQRFRADEGNQASPSPSTDGKHVWVFFGTGDTACVDVAGKLIWHFNATERYGKFGILHGMHMTPLLDGDRLYLALLHEASAWVVAVDKATGKELWKVARPTDGSFEGTHSYCSPTLYRKGDTAYLIAHGADYTTAHQLSDGKEIWRLGEHNPKGTGYDRTFRMIASPTLADDLIVLPTCKEGPVTAIKADAKGQLKADNPYQVWRVAGGAKSKTPDVPCPLIHNGLIYLVRERSRKSFMICMDLKTGKEHYSEALPADRYRATPVLADDKIYLPAHGGTVLVLKPGTEFKLLATNKLPDLIASSPALAGGRIYIRGYDYLYAFSVNGK